MFKLHSSIKAFVMLTIVFVGLITRILIGYGAYANPIHLHLNPTMEAATNTSVGETGELVLQHFKLKRKVALETLTHFPWELSAPTSLLILSVVRSAPVLDPVFHSQSSPPRLRPPQNA